MLMHVLGISNDPDEKQLMQPIFNPNANASSYA